MAFHRGIDGSEPLRAEPVGRVTGPREIRPADGAWRLGTGTLACPRCDAPVALAGGHVGPADRLGCPFCDHAGAVREFLSLAAPTRPARVEVRLVLRPRTAAGQAGIGSSASAP
jgi:hypothetical protein